MCRSASFICVYINTIICTMLIPEVNQYKVLYITFFKWEWFNSTNKTDIVISLADYWAIYSLHTLQRYTDCDTHLVRTLLRCLLLDFMVYWIKRSLSGACANPSKVALAELYLNQISKVHCCVLNVSGNTHVLLRRPLFPDALCVCVHVCVCIWTACMFTL